MFLWKKIFIFIFVDEIVDFSFLVWVTLVQSPHYVIHLNLEGKQSRKRGKAYIKRKIEKWQIENEFLRITPYVSPP